MKRTSLCYVIPHYSEDENQHFAHLPHFLDELSRFAEIYVIVEKGKRCDAFIKVRHVFWQKYGSKNRILRSMELLLLAIRIRRLGCKKFFVRISVPAAILLSLLGKLIDFRVYYWFSGQPTNNPEYFSILRLRFRHILLRLALKLCDFLVTGPESMGDYISKEFGIKSNKIIILYNDICINAYSNNEEKYSLRKELILPINQYIVLFVGRLSFLKGGFNILPIAERVLDKLENVLFVVVGPISFPDYKQKILNSPHKNKIVLRGMIPNNEIKQYYQSADLFILPSESEGFPRVLLEAMASGLSFVAFDVGGIVDIVDERQMEFVVQRGNHDVFAERVIDLLRSSDLRKRQGELSRIRVKKFDTSEVAKMFANRILDIQKDDLA